MLIVNCRGIWPDHVSLVRHCDISAAGVIGSTFVDQCGRCRDEVAGLARDETAGHPLQLDAARSHGELVQRLFRGRDVMAAVRLNGVSAWPTLTGVAAGVSSQSEGCPGHPCPRPAIAPACQERLDVGIA